MALCRVDFHPDKTALQCNPRLTPKRFEPHFVDYSTFCKMMCAIGNYAFALVFVRDGFGKYNICKIKWNVSAQPEKKPTTNTSMAKCVDALFVCFVCNIVTLLIDIHNNFTGNFIRAELHRPKSACVLLRFADRFGAISPDIVQPCERMQLARILKNISTDCNEQHSAL